MQSAARLEEKVMIASDELQLIHDPSISIPPCNAPCRDRKHLPASHKTSLPKFVPDATSSFPAVYQPHGEFDEDADLEDWAEVIRTALDENLDSHGAMLFRNIPGLETSQDLTMLSRYLKLVVKKKDQEYNMQGRSMQSTKINTVVRTASDEPPAYTIEPHNEFHTANLPHKVILFCATPPEKGGEWLCGDGRAIQRQLRPEVIEKFNRLGCKYQVFYESKADDNRYTNWQDNIAPTKDGVEQYLKSMNYEWKWNEDDSIRYWKCFPATVPHPISGEEVYFNQIHAHHKTFYTTHPHFYNNPVADGRWPVHSTYGDGTEIEEEVLEHIREVVWHSTVAVAPQKGDLLVCDNYLSLHGRLGFPEGVTREVYVIAAFS